MVQLMCSLAVTEKSVWPASRFSMLDITGHILTAVVVGVVMADEQQPVMSRSRTMMSPLPVKEMTIESTSLTPPISRFDSSTVVHSAGVSISRYKHTQACTLHSFSPKHTTFDSPWLERGSFLGSQSLEPEWCWLPSARRSPTASESLVPGRGSSP